MATRDENAEALTAGVEWYRRSMRMWVAQNLLYLHRIRMQEETERWDDILPLMRKVMLPLNLTLASNMNAHIEKGRASIAKRSDAGCQSFIPPLTLLFLYAY